jgi:hypothetical protein
MFYENKLPFLQGDALRGHCVYNTTGKNTTTHYGVDHGDEMCAFLLFYTPHVSSAVFDQNHLCSLLPG